MFKKIAFSLTALLLFTLAAPVQAAEYDLPSAGITPDSPFFFLDQFAERVSGLFAIGAEAKAKQAFNNAQERLSETKKLSDSKPEAVGKALNLYQNEFKKASDSAASPENKELSKLVSEATTKHLSVLEEVEDKVPEPAKEAIKNAREASSQGQINALNALAASDAPGAVRTALSAASERLKSSKEKEDKKKMDEVVDYTDKLRDLSERIQQRNKEAKEEYSQKITDLISQLGEAGDLEGLPEATKEKIKEMKGKSIDSQLDSLRGLAEENPQRAAEIYSKASKKFADKFKEEAEDKSEEELEEDAEQVQKYAEFGKEISNMAKGLRTGETTVRELVEKATSHHVKVLQDVKEKVPAQAQEGIERALQNAQKAQKGLENIPAEAGPPAGVGQGEEGSEEKGQAEPPSQVPTSPDSNGEEAGPSKQAPSQVGPESKKKVDSKQKKQKRPDSASNQGQESERGLEQAGPPSNPGQAAEQSGY